MEEPTYLCKSPAADPIDRHSSTTAVNRPKPSRNRGFRTVLIIWRDGGSLALAAFHEYPFPASMLSLYLPACSLSTSSPLACDMRIEELRALTESVFFASLCECHGGDCDCGLSSLAIGSTAGATLGRD